MTLGLGLGMPHIRTGAPAAGDAYHADAVHFDATSFQQRLTPLTLDSGVDRLLWSCWFANTVAGPSQGGDLDHIPMRWNGDLLFGSLNSGITPFLANFADEDDPFDYFNVFTNDNVYPIGAAWTHIIVSADLRPALGVNKIVQIFITGVQKATTIDQSSDGPISIPMQEDHYPLQLNSEGSNASIYDCADFQFYANVFADLTVPANLAKFIADGKPVDPALAIAEFGQPTILLSGDAVGFSTNQGTGGAIPLVQNPAKITTGHNGPGPVTLMGAVIGTPIVSIRNLSTATYVQADFESVISVTDQIQQTGAQNYSAHTLKIYLGGSLTNAATSPSD